jgi:hypothetical protein
MTDTQTPALDLEARLEEAADTIGQRTPLTVLKYIPEDTAFLLRQARAEFRGESAPVPAGAVGEWQWVPKVAPQAIIDAMRNRADRMEDIGGFHISVDAGIAEMWKAGLAAAPHPPEAPPITDAMIDAALVAWFHDEGNILPDTDIGRASIAFECSRADMRAALTAALAVQTSG